MGGKDSASTRYIFTQLATVTRKLFYPADDWLLEYQFEDDSRIEPHYYVPVIPLVLINGADGIGTGWSTNVPTYNPMDLIEAIRGRLNGQSFASKTLTPWFKGFQGTVEYSERNRSYEIQGAMERMGGDWLKITELPIRKWTADYKAFIEEILNSDQAWITEMKEYHTENRVHFEVKIPNLDQFTDSELTKKLKLLTNLSLTNMVLFDSNRKIKKYNDIAEIMEEFFGVRLDYYHRRKAYLCSKLAKDCEVISNKVRFILEVIAGTVVLGNVKRRALVLELQRKGFATKTQLDKIFKEMALYSSSESSTTEVEEAEVEAEIKTKDYDYLLGMPLWSLTFEKVEELKKEKAEKMHQLEVLKATSEENLWIQDLDDLSTSIVETWAKEEEDRLSSVKTKAKRVIKPKQARKPRGKENTEKPSEPAKQTKLTSLAEPEPARQTKQSSFTEPEPDLMARLLVKNPKIKPPLVVKSMTDESEVSDADSAIQGKDKPRKRQLPKAKEPRKKAVQRPMMLVSELDDDSDFEL
jgi:DNA topoisomerase-2